ncbi:MAG: MFS transporter [Chromatiales bacterium]|jgi:MFS family permease|nr:MAG: MFS transporter [Chromatiales bacterium]
MTDIPGQSPPRARFLLGLGVLLFAIGQSLTFVIVTPLARQVGFDAQSFGIALTLASLPLIFGAPYWGRRSDVIGRKPVFLIGITGAAVGTLLIALVLQLGVSGIMTGMSLLVLFALARAAYGAAASAIYPAASAYMVDVTDIQHRGQGLAIIGAANGMGSVLGPALAGALAFFGPLVPMYVAALIGLGGVVMTWYLLPEPTVHADARSKIKLKLGDTRLRPFLIMWFVFFLTFMALQLILSFYLQDEYGITDPKALVRTASLMLVSMAAMIVVVQIGVLQVFKVQPKVLLRLLGPFFVVALVIIGLAPNLVVMAVGFGVLGLSFACANPGINGCASLCVEPWEQGAAAGFLGAGNTLGAILGPIIGTQIYTRLGHHGPMIVGAVALTALSIYAFTIKMPDHAKPARDRTP